MKTIYAYGIKDGELISIPIEVSEKKYFESEESLPFIFSKTINEDELGKVQGYGPSKYVYLSEENMDLAMSILSEGIQNEIDSKNDFVNKYLSEIKEYESVLNLLHKE